MLNLTKEKRKDLGSFYTPDSLILPNINDLQRVLNADNIQHYNMQYRPHLVHSYINEM